MTQAHFYFKQDHQEFFFEGSNFIRQIDNRKIPIPIKFEGNYLPEQFLVLKVIEYKNLYIIFFSWKLDRNLICLDRDTNEIIWRIPGVKKVWDKSNNAWCEIFIKDEEPDTLYCLSVDRYSAAFKIETGEMIHERFPKNPDPRDF